MTGHTLSDDTAFDAASLGLLSHYGAVPRTRIRRLILEDWQTSGIKLPTYMKLLARHIAPSKRKMPSIPEGWLSKLSHQTMAKMLAGTSTPRYEFWACLHLYLTKKYGPVDIDPELTDADILGQAISRFGSDCTDPPAGQFELDSCRELTLRPARVGGYTIAEMLSTANPNQNQLIKLRRKAEGVAFAQGHSQNSQIHLILRDIITQSIELQSVDIPLSDERPNA